MGKLKHLKLIWKKIEKLCQKGPSFLFFRKNSRKIFFKTKKKKFSLIFCEKRPVNYSSGILPLHFWLKIPEKKSQKRSIFCLDNRKKKKPNKTQKTVFWQKLCLVFFKTPTKYTFSESSRHTGSEKKQKILKK